MSNPRVLGRAYFARDTLAVARGLLGKYLVRRAASGRVAGKIIEVEAYVGFDDRASHASRGQTPRTELMFGPAGFAYVYLVYGMHHCFNVVTQRAGYPAAVLVRAVEQGSVLVDGPGRVCRALGIDRELNGVDLTVGRRLWLEDRGERIPVSRITSHPRIGVEYAGEWASRPWRFRVTGH